MLTPELQERAGLLESAFAEAGAPVRVVGAVPGPVVSTFECELREGERVSWLVAELDSIAIRMRCGPIRPAVDIPGQPVRLEVPNPIAGEVKWHDLMPLAMLMGLRAALPIGLGVDAAGRPFVADLVQMPHVLIAGSPGSGRKTLLRSVILNLLLRPFKGEVEIVLIHSRKDTRAVWSDIVGLPVSVVTGAKQVCRALDAVTREMERRYQLLADAGVRHVSAYNQQVSGYLRGGSEILPYLVVLIEDLDSLMAEGPGDVEDPISHLGQMSRAAGIHLIISTGDLSPEVLTWIIERNVPARIALRADSRADSRSIIWRSGAEFLLGRGDMLYQEAGKANLIRVHGSLVSEEIARMAMQKYYPQRDSGDVRRFKLQTASPVAGCFLGAEGGTYRIPLHIADQIPLRNILALQRKLKIGYNRAWRLVRQLALDLGQGE